MAAHSGKDVIKTKSPKRTKAKSGKAAKVNRGAVPAANARERDLVSDLKYELERGNVDLNEAREQQAATAEVLKVINASTGNLTAVFEIILEKAHSLCDVPCGSLQLFDDDHTRAVAVRGMSESFEKYLRQGYRFDRSQPVQLVRPFQIDDLSKVIVGMPHGSPLQVAFELGCIKTMLSVPLVKDSVALGRIVAARQEVRPFSEHQIAVLRSFADQAVIAIENARLFNEVQAKTRDLEESLQQQTATANVLKVISRSAFDLQAVLQTLVESAARLCGADKAQILRPSDSQHFFAAASYGHTPEYNEYLSTLTFAPGREGVVGRVLLESKPVQIADVLSDPDYRLWETQRLGGFRTHLGVPLLREGTPIGILIVSRVTVRPFDDKQIELLVTFADQAVIAIQNTRLFNETQEALERQTATAEILRVIASSPSDVQPVFEAIAASAKRLLGGFSSTVYRFIDGQAHLKAFTPTTPEADTILKSSFPRPVADLAAFRMTQVGEVMQIPDTEDPSYELKDIARARGYRSMLFAPLMNTGTSIGFIAVTRVQPGSFTDHHVQLLKTFADQAVIAIENVRLFDEVQAKTRDLTEALQQQTATAEVLKVISRSTFDLPAVLQALVETAARLCNADKGAITRQKDGMFYRAESFGFSEDFMNYVRGVPVDRHSATGRALYEGVVVHIPDVEADRDYTFKGQRLGDFRAVLGVPMLREGAPIGVITLTRTEPEEFTDKQIELAITFADQAAIAIENVRLFDEVQERTRELSQSLDDLRKAQDRLIQTEKLASLGQLTAGIAHEIKNPLNFVNNFSALSIELTDELNDLLKQAALAEKLRGEVDELTTLLKDNLSKVVQHGKRADSIVKNMLLHSREGSGERRTADINALVKESLNLAYHGARAERAGFSITLHDDLDPNAGALDLYPQEFTRALLNLISNGFYAATRRKAESGDEAFEPVLSAATSDRGETVVIRIRDNGTGISPEVRAKMFNPFFTTKPTGEGTGLGLSMTHDIIVKQHGGRIDVETEPGVFTEFIITLPRDNGTVVGRKPE